MVTIQSIYLGIAIYLLLGLIVIVVFDLLTKGRIRKRLGWATTETQTRLIASGNYVSNKTAKLLFFGALLIFWPFMVIGATTGRKKEDSDGS